MHTDPPIIESSGDDDNATAGQRTQLRPDRRIISLCNVQRTGIYTNHHFLPGLDVHHTAHAHV
jgi:hypothetical protein